MVTVLLQEIDPEVLQFVNKKFIQLDIPFFHPPCQPGELRVYPPVFHELS